MGTNDKVRLKNIAYELYKDARMKLKQVDGLKDEACPFTAFGVGTLMGTLLALLTQPVYLLKLKQERRIREKYRSMMELYRMTRNRYTGAAKILLPGIEPWRPLHYIIRLEEIRALEVEIDQLILALESLPDDAPKFDLKLLVGNAKPKPKSTTPETSSEEEK
ncbi:unnamed protein product [Leptosia nina]|uniref:Uncharacterized protein n=1 Tax=Leptosia nina TaxID=320188 RepID=A0AAV1JUQ8_9NEOP